MKAIISTTYSDTYLYFLPIATWAWNKLGVDVICFLPYSDYMGNEAKNQVPAQRIRDTLLRNNLQCELHYFNAPENKKSTYAQCSRLYAACLDLPEDEVLVTSDVDMAVFSIPPYIDDNTITIFGADLVPSKQFPMCYASATVKYWGESMGIFETDYNPIVGNFISSKRKTYQEKLDELLLGIECENMRGNYWGKDQEELYNKTWEDACLMNRAKEGTQFSTNRYDRDDAYLLERLNPDTIDFHMPRPGYEDKNFEIILKVLQYHYPNDNFQWLIDFTNEYKKLL